MTSAIMAFLHHLAAFTLTGSIFYELVTFRKDLTLAEARRIQRMDIAYGVSAALILIVGLLRVFTTKKALLSTPKTCSSGPKWPALPWLP